MAKFGGLLIHKTQILPKFASTYAKIEHMETTTTPNLAPPHPKHLKVWLVVWLALYLAIIVLGLVLPYGSPVFTLLSVGSVLLCSIYALVTFPRDHLLQVAMLTTFAADILMAGDNASTVGLTVFFLAQCWHLYRLLPPQTPRFWVIGLIATSIIAMLMAQFTQFVEPFFVIVSFYALTLLANLWLSWQWREAEPRNFYANCAFWGFFLFVCCDLCTAISFLSFNQMLAAFLYAPANFLAWFFYYPSQILVSNSSKCGTMVTKEGKC